MCKIKNITDLEDLDEEYVDELEIIKKSEKSVVLFGAGCTSGFIIQRFREFGIEPVIFCDNDINKIGMVISKINVISVKDAVTKYKDNWYYITTQLYYCPMRLQLLTIGIPEENIICYDFICQFEWEKNYKKYFMSNIELFKEIYEKYMKDPFSKQVFLARIAFLITRKREYVMSVRGNKQYFEPQLIDYQTIGEFIDIGTYIGDSIIDFLKYNCNPECRIWGFEPSDCLYKQAVINTISIHNTKIVKKAISDTNGIVSVQGTLGVMQTIDEKTKNSFIENKNENIFEACTLDNFFCGEKLINPFVKIDIEGAEMLALHGGKEIIRKYIPILAVCVYHKADDVITIIKFIIKQYPNYKFYLRHYSDNQTETVLYAIPEWGEVRNGK